jgi:hypothetical protein
MANPLLILPIGIVITCIGYGPLSRKKNPTAGGFFIIVGFLFRVIGPLLIVWGAFFWVFLWSMAFDGSRHT